ncbi:MAG: DUF2656 domain-containing protein [Oscillatoria sp. SIO1A7]|nr:DUF2656 domain-containing protein [Oscillatoria sp. SIO1A7]
MSQSETTRMLISHNFDLPEDSFRKFSREEFTQIFADGFSQYPEVQCRQLSHPHWIVEILFPKVFSPPQIGEICAGALAQSRSKDKGEGEPGRDILILGGLKKTPPTSDSPETLQPGEWGVDGVETLSADRFLSAIAWNEKTAGKTIENVFKVELRQ